MAELRSTASLSHAPFPLLRADRTGSAPSAAATAPPSLARSTPRSPERRRTILVKAHAPDLQPRRSGRPDHARATASLPRPASQEFPFSPPTPAADPP